MAEQEDGSEEEADLDSSLAQQQPTDPEPNRTHDARDPADEGDPQQDDRVAPRRRVQRALAFGTFALLLAAVLYFQFGQPPFVAVGSDSMEPNLYRGDLILVSPVNPALIEEGDIIVVKVPQEIREHYGYPHSIVHRVVEIRESPTGSVGFRLQGDNSAAQDPFTVTPGDVSGQVDAAYSKAGYPILYFQSREGQIFLVSVALIYTLYTFSGAISNRGDQIRMSVSRTLNEAPMRRLDAIGRTQESALVQVNESLEAFAGAMKEYAEHLRSHTAAVQGLAEAAQSLREAALGREGTIAPQRTDPSGQEGDPHEAKKEDEENPHGTDRCVEKTGDGVRCHNKSRPDSEHCDIHQQ